MNKGIFKCWFMEKGPLNRIKINLLLKKGLSLWITGPRFLIFLKNRAGIKNS